MGGIIMTKRVSFAQKLDRVMAFYHIKKLTLSEALEHSFSPAEKDRVRELYVKHKGFVMRAESKYPDKTAFVNIQQSQNPLNPSKNQGIKFFIEHVLYSTLDS
jgi:hypothetical protein